MPSVLDHWKLTSMSLVPKYSASARAESAPMQAMLPAYDGYGGVVRSGIQFGSASVAGFRSSPARWMAVTGRHIWNTYLLACAVCTPSIIETFSSANMREDSTRLRLLRIVMKRPTWFQMPAQLSL